VTRLVGHLGHAQVRAVADTLLEEIATRPEIAALRALMRQGQLASDRHQGARRLVGARQGDAAEQALGVGMAHLVEDLFDRTALDHDTGVHHVHPLAGLEDQPQIMRDVDHRGFELPGDLADQLDDAGLHRHVQRRGRLVEQQQRWVRQQGHGDDHALLLATRDLVRVDRHDALGVRQVHVGENLLGAFVGFRLADVVVADRHFHELPPR
jgi:hypothetical protein